VAFRLFGYFWTILYVKISLLKYFAVLSTTIFISTDSDCAVPITEEITRVKQILASAANRFQGHFEEDDDDTEDEDDDEDYYKMTDLPIDDDGENFHSDCDE
jgi:hypothetical protein